MTEYSYTFHYHVGPYQERTITLEPITRLTPATAWDEAYYYGEREGYGEPVKVVERTTTKVVVPKPEQGRKSQS